MGKLPARGAVVAAFVLALVLPHAAMAAPGEVKVFPTEGFPLAIAPGSDGNMWFTDPGTPPLFPGGQIGKITPAGEASKYTPGLSGYPWGIAKGPDGNVWFTEPGAQKVGYVKPSEPASSTMECSVPGMLAEPSYRSLIAAGPDGNVWVTLDVNGIGRVTPGCVVTEFRAGLNAEADVCSITAGPDGNLWFGDCGTPTAVGKITPAGAITEYEVPWQPRSITAGPDGNLWFTQANEEVIGRITPSGTLTTFPAPSQSLPASLTVGPDGNLWAENRFSQNQRVGFKLSGEGGIFKLGFEGQETGWTGKGTLTSGSTSVTGVTTTSGTIVKQERISGPGIPANTRVTNCSPASGMACINPTSLTLSAAPTESTAGATLSVDLAAQGTCGLNTPCQTSAIKEALQKLTTIGAGNVNVTGALTEKSITFIGKFARINVWQPPPFCTLTLDGSCSGFEVIDEAVPHELMRITSSGVFTEYPLSPPIGFAPFSENTLASDDAGHLWFSVWEPESGVARFEVPIYRQLNIEVRGPGTVLISPGGVTCPPLCEPELALGSKITLTADPDPKAVFVSWKGCDAVNGRQCTVTMDKARGVIATFVGAPELTLTKAPGSGLGKVTSYPGGILCLPNCSTTSANFKEGAKVKLTATPFKHFHFVEWLGDCTGPGLCELTMSEGRDVEALFAEDAEYSLSLTKKGGGQGTVKSSPAGINCGTTCDLQAAGFYEGTVVVLTATVQAGKGSTFTGWFGSGCSGTGTCTVTMSEAKAVAAEFE